MRMTKILSLLLLLLLIGCASIKKTVTMGMAMGATGGAASGALIAQRMRGEAAIEMGIIGMIFGGLSGYFIHKGIGQEAERVRRQTLLNLATYGTAPTIDGENTPAVVPPMVESYDIKAKVEGKKLIGPHRVWMIREEARWRLDGKQNRQ